MEIRESQRRLAAIVFTDIVGYTSMMQHDENLALSAVRKHHEALQQCVPSHGGTIQQYTGDGSLSIFNSATDAIQCALEFQKYLLLEPVVPVRIGIHIGEIYTEEGKIFGDGVNIASRIESIGQGGTVLFSRDVYEKIRNRTEFQTRSIGSFEFKNVDDPVEVYALTNPEIRTPDLKAIEGKLKEQVKKKKLSTVYLSAIGVFIVAIAVVGIYLYPKDAITAPESIQYKSSIAVLPFDNLSDNPEESSFLSTGLAEDILTQLAQIKELKVISRSSSMKYKDYEAENITLRTIAKDLGVTNILEGSVRKYGNKLRINVNLIDPEEGNLIWSKEFDSDLEDVLNLQRDVALAVSDKLKITLTPEVKTRFEDKLNVDPVAFMNYHKGREALGNTSGTLEEITQALNYFEKAIQIDSNYSQAWVGLADGYLELVFWHRVADEEALPRAARAARMALKIDPDLGEAYGALGAVDLLFNDLESSEANFNRCLTLTPNYAVACERFAWVYLFTGRPKEGFAIMEKAIQLDPLFTRYKGSLGNAYYMTERYDEGIARMAKFLEIHPGDNFILWTLAYLNAGKGNYAKAIEYLDQRTVGKGTNWVYSYCYSKLGNADASGKILDQMIEKKKTDFVPDYMIAVAYEANGRRDEALTYLANAVGKGGESFFTWNTLKDPMLASLRKDPRFQKIEEKLRKIYRY